MLFSVAVLIIVLTLFDTTLAEMKKKAKARQSANGWLLYQPFHFIKYVKLDPPPLDKLFSLCYKQDKLRLKDFDSISRSL